MTIEDAVRAEAEADRLASRAAMKADSARGRLAASRGAGLSETEMAVLAAEADNAMRADEAAEDAYTEAARVLAAARSAA